jgi:hypothetical protein
MAVLFRDGSSFSVTGWLFAAGLCFAAFEALRGGARPPAARMISLAFAAPFFAAWWCLASYDVRFLVMIVPVLSVASAMMLGDAVPKVAARLPVAWRIGGSWLTASLIIALAVPSIQVGIQGKRAIVQNPWMNDFEKHEVRLGGVYDLAVAINGLPESSRVLGVPALSIYHIDRGHMAGISQAVPAAPPWELASVWDFVVYHLSAQDTPPWASASEPILATHDGYFLYSTNPTPGK